MIENFADSLTEAVFDGKSPKGFPADLVSVTRRKLDMLNKSRNVQDLRSPPGNRLEALRGNLEGLFSIRINDQWRIVFRWSNGGASEVKVMDYH
jgi:Plasmid maintenance system killer protein